MLFVAAIVFCLAASAYDYFERRVPNWLNAAYFSLAVIASLDLTGFALFSAAYLAFAYLLYFFGVWGAGDAKFFAVLAAFSYAFNGVSLQPIVVLVVAALLAFAYSLKDSGFLRRSAAASKKTFFSSLAPAAFLWLLPSWLLVPGALLAWLFDLPAYLFPLFVVAGFWLGAGLESLAALYALFFVARFAFSLKGLKRGLVTFFAPFLSAAFLAVLVW